MAIVLKYRQYLELTSVERKYYQIQVRIIRVFVSFRSSQVKGYADIKEISKVLKFGRVVIIGRVAH